MRRLVAAFALTLGATTVALAQEKPPVRWTAANPSYHATGRGGQTIRYVVVHTIEGSAGSGINTFRSGGRRVSAHYIVDFDGAITQMVKDEDAAWHAGNSTYNRRSIGIEHAGWAGRNNWTMAQYQASARITRWACDRYGIPKDRQHILGHKEVPGATHGDPGRFFDWNLYMRLVTGGASVEEAGPDVQAIRPAANQVVGRGDTQDRAGMGLLVEWSTKGPRPQASARVFVEEVGGSLRYESGSLSSAETKHRVQARLRDGGSYRWKVRVWDGSRQDETDWISFRADFDAPTIAVVSPASGATVQAAPTLRWRYDDPDGAQVSYRVWLDDDEDHTRVIGDTKELNGATQSYTPRTTLQPDRTYWWRAMGYDGHGNTALTAWTSFRTSADYPAGTTPGTTSTSPLTVTALGDEGAVVAAIDRATLRWSTTGGQGQRTFRVQVAKGSQVLYDETYTSAQTGYRVRPLEPGSYRWRVQVSDGSATAATAWQSFSVVRAVRGLDDFYDAGRAAVDGR